MTKDKRIRIARGVQDLYLYPSRTRAENIVRGIVWIVSWLVGIVVQDSTTPQALGGAYFIFALSLRLEFIPEKRMTRIAVAMYGVFNFMLICMVFCSVILIMRISSEGNTTDPMYYVLAKDILPWIGIIVFLIMFIGIILITFEAHKLFYNEQLELEQKKEHDQQAVRAQYYANFEGPQKGGNT